MRDPVVIPVSDSSATGEVRRAAVALAAAVGFDEERQGRVALVATEAAANLAKHATGGEVVIRSLFAAEGGGVEILALDRGPGIADLARCLRDGYSTAGTAGAGLGAIGRLADGFDLTSTPGVGTALVARLRKHDPAPAGVEAGAVCLPVGNEQACGDGWAVASTPVRTAILLVDGLGHGLLAATAAQAAVTCFRERSREEPAEIMHALHGALRSTRGAAAAVAVIDHPARALRFAGIGNIAGVVLALGRRQGLVSHGGMLGHSIRKVQTFEYVWPAGAVLVLHSDGLGTQWDLTRYGGLALKHPALVAGVLYRDFRRGQDDVTILAARDTTEETTG